MTIRDMPSSLGFRIGPRRQARAGKIARGDDPMLKKSLAIGAIATAVAAGTLSTPASAGDPVLGALVGGGIGAAIGHSVNGRNGAWVGGALGAVTGASIAANSGYYGSYGPPAVYSEPAPAYYGGAPAYYAPPAVYAPAPVYVAPPVVVARPRPVYVRPYVARPVYARGYGWHRDWHGYNGYRAY
jgi:hypothetical protein